LEWNREDLAGMVVDLNGTRQMEQWTKPDLNGKRLAKIWSHWTEKI
jgi:hypothetical protein